MPKINEQLRLRAARFSSRVVTIILGMLAEKLRSVMEAAYRGYIYMYIITKMSQEFKVKRTSVQVSSSSS